MDVLSPFIVILCHSDWLFHRESCPRLDDVYPGRASLLWQCLLLLQLCWKPTHLFSLLSTKHAEAFSVLSSQRPQDVFLHSSWVSSFHSRTWLQATLALSLVLSSLKSVCCDFSIFSAVMPRLPALYLTWYAESHVFDLHVVTGRHLAWGLVISWPVAGRPEVLPVTGDVYKRKSCLVQPEISQ